MRDFVTAKQRVQLPKMVKEKELTIELKESEVVLLHSAISNHLLNICSDYRKSNLQLINKKIEINLNQVKISRLIAAF